MNIPAVIERTSEGIQRYAIQDVMLQRREIDCVGKIDRESVNAIILQLRYLQSLDDAREITIQAPPTPLFSPSVIQRRSAMADPAPALLTLRWTHGQLHFVHLGADGDVFQDKAFAADDGLNKFLGSHWGPSSMILCVTTKS